MAGRRRALIVANDVYEHEGLRRLVAPAADAAALAGVLGDPRIGDFGVQVVHNEPAHVVQAQVEELFADARAEDVLLLHFSCHGVKSDSGELFFAARNTRPNRLASTAVSADFVQRCLRASRSRSVVLLLDCCYGAAFGQGVAVRSTAAVNVLDSFPAAPLGGGRGRAVITASSAVEYAFEGDRLAEDQAPQPSVFTAALVEGLASGEADRDEDGWVSLNELYEYVFDAVRSRTPHQTPSRDIEMQGELYLARSRRRRVRPVPVPADLAAASTDPNLFTRLGAVSELRARLASDNLPVAAGAHAALTEMAQADISYVADAARTALREAALRVEAAEIDLGEVAQGAPSASATVPLLGPPLARAGNVEASDPWLRAEVSGERVEVSADTSRAGDLTGSITLSGWLGRVVVPVRVRVTGGERAGTPPAAPPVVPVAPPVVPQPVPPSVEPAATAVPDPAPTAAPVPLAAGAPLEPADAAAAEAPTPVRTRTPGERLHRAGGLLAVGSALLLVLALPLGYQWGYALTDQDNGYSWPAYGLVVAALAAGAGSLVLAGGTRLVAAAGVLLGTAAASTWGLAFSVTRLGEDGLGPAYWLILLAHLALPLAAGLVGLALYRETGPLLVRRQPDWYGWAGGALGVAGAVCLALVVRHLLFVYGEGWAGSWSVLPLVVLALVGVAVPAAAALTAVRPLRVALLAGWVVAAAGLVGYYLALPKYDDPALGGPFLAYAATLLGLAVVAGLLARTPVGDAAAGADAPGSDSAAADDRAPASD